MGEAETEQKQKKKKKPRGRGKKRVELTVLAAHAGLIEMAGDDGTRYACTRQNAGGALYGDRVLARRAENGRVVVDAVLSRANERIVGLYRAEEATLRPLNRHLPRRIAVERGGCGAQDGDLVCTEVVRWGGEGGLLTHITNVIGPYTQARAAIEALIESERLPDRFDADALQQAELCRPADLRDDPAREDFRGLCLFTIDGRDAQDFDDAVSLERIDNGFRLGVHIADVGHYVPQGSALDREALKRGTSVYFPGRVVPMLPERLCNGVCSLRPNEDKFTLSALVDLDNAGGIVSFRLARSITRSRARLVYDDVNAMFDGDFEQTANMAALSVRETLLDMRDLARRIRSLREAKGCIDFELNEPEFELDERGEPVDVQSRPRGEAERMIEDFMLTANACVARFARESGLPILYRVHKRPSAERLNSFADFLEGLGVEARELRESAPPRAIRAVLQNTRWRPERDVIAIVALRSMERAYYGVKPEGHYGLAMEDYCHFTSPIRRYPDLVVSRALTAALCGRPVTLTGQELKDAAAQSTEREGVAAEAERAGDRMMMARYMASHVGEKYDGTISFLAEFGFFVTLKNGVEGIVHARTLGEWFELDEQKIRMRGLRTGATITIGQAVCVRVLSVDLAESRIEFEWAAEDEEGAVDGEEWEALDEWDETLEPDGLEEGTEA